MQYKQRFCLALLAAVPLLGLGACAASESAPAGPQTAVSAAEDHPPLKPLLTDTDDADSLEQALEQNPGHVPVLMRLADLALSIGNNAKAIEHLRKVTELEPQNAEARLELGRALWNMGDRSGAAAQTAAILEFAPRNVDALYNLGAIYANQKQTDQALEYWARAVDADPFSESGKHAQRGIDILNGRTPAIPDIPEHRALTQTSQQPKPINATDRQKIIDFAAENK